MDNQIYDEQETDAATETGEVSDAAHLTADAPSEDPKTAAQNAVPLAMNWVRSAINMLSFAHRAAVNGPPRDPMGRLAMQVIRRHFHTDRLKGPMSEPNAIQTLRPRFEDIRRFLTAGDSIFVTADDETAAEKTRGYFGSEYTVAAYAYSRSEIAFTSQFPGLGPRCRAAVLIHQLAHYIDSRVTDMTGSKGAAYDNLGFESAVLNVHCYPNFAVNAFPPYADERYGMLRPEE